MRKAAHRCSEIREEVAGMRPPRAVVVSVAVLTASLFGAFGLQVQGQTGATEAPAGFDNRTNGLVTQAEFDALKAKALG